MANGKRVYRVLTESPADENMEKAFAFVGDFEAGDPRGAIREAAEQNGVGPMYVAVAESSWHEETPAADPRVRLRWS